MRLALGSLASGMYPKTIADPRTFPQRVPIWPGGIAARVVTTGFRQSTAARMAAVARSAQIE